MKRPTHILNRLSLHSNRAWVVAGDVRRVFSEAKVINNGAYRTAYRLGPYVIKQGSNHPKMKKLPVSLLKLRQTGMQIAQQWWVNGWVVQPYYRLARNEQIGPWWERVYNLGLYRFLSRVDLGYGNMGIDDKGRLTAFDW